MNENEFAKAVKHQTEVLEKIREILRANAMELTADDGSVVLIDNGRDIGYTGFYL